MRGPRVGSVPLRFISCLAALLAQASARPALGAEPRVSGAVASLHVTGDPRTLSELQAGEPLSVYLVGPGQLTLTLRAVQPIKGPLTEPTVLLAVDGADQLRVALIKGRAIHFTTHHDLAAGPASTRSLKVGEGAHTVQISVSKGAAAVALHFEPGVTGPLAVTPLVGREVPAAPLVAGVPQTVRPGPDDPPYKLPPPSVEPEVPLTVDAPNENRGRTWPIYVMVGALTCAVGGGVLWAVAASTDGTYNTTPTGPGRNSKLANANNELHIAVGLGAAAAVLLATSAIGLAF